MSPAPTSGAPGDQKLKAPLQTPNETRAQDSLPPEAKDPGSEQGGSVEAYKAYAKKALGVAQTKDAENTRLKAQLAQMEAKLKEYEPHQQASGTGAPAPKPTNNPVKEDMDKAQSPEGVVKPPHDTEGDVELPSLYKALRERPDLMAALKQDILKELRPEIENGVKTTLKGVTPRPGGGWVAVGETGWPKLRQMIMKAVTHDRLAAGSYTSEDFESFGFKSHGQDSEAALGVDRFVQKMLRDEFNQVVF
jgi:hypothetical protein